MPAEHRFLKLILPARAFEAVRAGTKKWVAECCTCGRKQDVWDAGGVRYMAAGEPKEIAFCPSCSKATKHRIRKKTEAERLGIP